ncbi:MAG: DUF1761 domain-containing protein [Alphaproteobacteria bacterium]|nr:DUF1761 domain-containing protein [Alphaproteobacteria bacterium]
MEMGAAFAGLNWIAVVAAAAAAFFAGAIWYGPLFAKAWMAGFGFKEEELEGRHHGKIFGLTFVLNLVMAWNLAMFLGPEADLMFGVMAGFFTGFGFVAPLIGVFYLFEGRCLKLFFVNAGFAVVSFTLMGAVVAAFN